MLRKLIIFFAAAALAGCAIHNVQLYGKIDNADKTVTVPPGAEGLKGKLKQALANSGWRLVVYNGPTVTEGHVGEHTKVEQFDTFKTRYKLLVSSDQFDLCMTLAPDINYDVSLIDNTSGAEVFTVSGRGCEPDAVKAFMRALQGKGG